MKGGLGTVHRGSGGLLQKIFEIFMPRESFWCNLRLDARLETIKSGGGGAPQGGRGGGRLPNFRLQYKGVPKSPLLSLFCNSVYWLKPHNNVNS